MVGNQPIVSGGFIEERALHSHQWDYFRNCQRQSVLQCHGEGLAPIAIKKATGTRAINCFQIGSDCVAFGLRAAMLDYCETMGEQRHFRVVDEATCSRVTVSVTGRPSMTFHIESACVGRSGARAGYPILRVRCG